MRGLFVSLLTLSMQSIFCQNNTSFGIDYTFQYNYKVAHHSLSLGCNINNNNKVFAGIQKTAILEAIRDTEDDFEKKSKGVHFGYEYLFYNPDKHITPLIRFNYFIYKLKYVEFQKGPPFSINREKFILENTIAIGIRYSPFEKLKMSTGVGFGSQNAFFLMIDLFIPNSFINVAYEF